MSYSLVKECPWAEHLTSYFLNIAPGPFPLGGLNMGSGYETTCTYKSASEWGVLSLKCSCI